MRRDDKGIFEKPPGSGKWWAAWRDSLGKLHRKCVGSKSAASEYHQKQRNVVREERLFPEKIASRKRSALTVRALLEHYEPEWQRKRSAKDDDRYARFWTEELGDIVASEVTPGHIERWRSRRLTTEGVRPGTVNRATSFLRRIINCGIRDGLLFVPNPASGLRCPKLPEENEVFRVLFASEEPLLRAQTSQDEWEKIELAYLTGLRAGEQFGLRASDVDLAGAVLWVRTGEGKKSKKARQVPLSDRAVEILSALMADGRDFLYPGRFPGTSYQPNSALRMIQAAADEAKLQHLTWNCLRHTFGTRYIENGGSIHDLKEIMGHSSIVVTQRYLTSNLDRARVTMNRMAGATTPHVRAVKPTNPVAERDSSIEQASVSTRCTTGAPNPNQAKQSA